MSLPNAIPFSSADMTEEELGTMIEEFLSKAPEGDRRKHERVRNRKFAVLVYVDRAGGDTSFMVLTENMSRNGLAFKHSSGLVPGTSCTVKVMLPNGGTLESSGKIAHCSRSQDDSFEIGLKLEQLLSVSLMAS